ncbi:MAG: hypothetical protein KF884_07275 [Fimbriimonadaceae bacterium]|nr:MAG: hypothetical protein KF884_07275 [Fimbriimonadaceae bacterium]
MASLRGPVVVAVALSLSCLALSQDPFAEAAQALKWREVGPWRGGRSVAVSGVPGRPKEFYMGTTGGGLWKSTDEGQNWACVSDGFFEWGSVGAIGVSPSQPDTVYVGMGECDIRGNISPGDGVYKSTDGGKTWANVGLRETKFIAKARVHPTDPDTVYVAALGPVFGPSRHRGVYKTTDGGRNWSQILFVDDRSGAIDVEIDPHDPQALWAATWTAWRTPYTLNSGGPGSKLWKSKDGGATWEDLSRNPGMPESPLGKIGVAPSPADPSRVYAIVEAKEGGVFVSDDRGATWTRTNEDRNWRQRAWYYTHIVAHPTEKDTCWVLNVMVGKSTNGGKTFTQSAARHVDNHDLWIDPADPNRMVIGNDGGACVSTDGGRTWTEQDFPTAQFYHVSADNAFPYRLLGAQQDNSTARVPSRTQGRGIGPNDWTSTAGGESGHVVAHPRDPDIVVGGSYGGYLTLQNHRTGENRNISAWPDNPMGHGAADLRHRFQWTFPILFSSHRPYTLYVGSQHVLASDDLGGSWREISPDLTRNDKSKMGPSGGPITKDNTSVEYYGTVFALAESPRKRGLLWAGSDDGLLHVTTDGGKRWSNVTPPQMPDWGLVSLIEASPHDPDTAYVAANNYKNDDHTPFLFVTRDLGKTWKRIDGGLPRDSFTRAVREDPTVKGLLYCGTETGLFVSPDGGGQWTRADGGLPKTPVHNLVVAGSDLAVATHGRSFWILDDLTPLRDLARSRQTGVWLSVNPVSYRVRWGSTGGLTDGKNPSSGVTVTYRLTEKVEKLIFEFVGPDGTVWLTDEGQKKEPGVHRFAKWLAVPGAQTPQGFILWNGGGRPMTLPPGEYTVRMRVGQQSLEAKTRWTRDPRKSASDRDLNEQFQFARQVSSLFNEVNQSVLAIRKAREALAKAPESRQTEAKRLVAETTAIEQALYQTQNRSGQDPLNFPIRLNDKIAGLLGVVLGGDSRPTRQSYAVFAEYEREYRALAAKLNPLLEEAAKLAP